MIDKHPSTTPVLRAILCAMIAIAGVLPGGCGGRPAADDSVTAQEGSAADDVSSGEAGSEAARADGPGVGFAAQMEQGRRLERDGQPDQARDLYLRLANEFPQRYEPLQRLGILADRAQRFDEAREFYVQAIRLRPDDPELQSDLGYSLFLHSKLDQAERELLKAVVLAPLNPRSRNNLALVYAHQGRYQEALEQFRCAGSEADAHYNLGCVLASMGNYPGARRCAERALAIDPRHRRAMKALEEFRGLEDAAGQADPGPPAGAPEQVRPPSGRATRTAEVAGHERTVR